MNLFKRINLGGGAILSCLLSATTFSPCAYANIIDTTYGTGAGSFELGNFVDGGHGYQTLGPGSATMVGWTVGGPGDGIDWLVSPTFAASAGIHSVDLRSQQNSSVSTVIPTTLGARYRISFSTASVMGYNVDGMVSAGSLSNQSFIANASASAVSQTFEAFEFMFDALSTLTTISFVATGPTLAACSQSGACYGPVIDAVSVLEVPVVPAVPEPSSTLLFVIGVFALYPAAVRARKNVWRIRS